MGVTCSRHCIARSLGVWILALHSLFTAPSAEAFERFPEFRSLTEEEERQFEGPGALGPEYQSDVLTYMKPEKWEYIWLSQPRAMDFSIGSLGPAHFLIDNRVKVYAPLNDWIQFRFTYFDERDRESESLHHILELVFWPSKNLGFSLYGEPSLYKREDDTGLALIYKPHERHEIRLFNTFVDVTRQKRNDRPDRYIEPDLPYSRGLVGRLWSAPESGKSEFLEYAARYETRTRWLFPVEKYEYQYWKWFASVFWRKQIQPDWYGSIQMQVDRKFESKAPTDPTSTVQSEAWLRDRWLTHFRTSWDHFGPNRNWELTAGIQYAYRQWEVNGAKTTYKDLIPHGILSVPAFGTGATRDRWEFGYDFTWHHLERGPGVLLVSDDEDGIVNHRLNLVYEFRFRNEAKLRLMITADLDKFGTRDSWEGGNGQFQMVF